MAAKPGSFNDATFTDTTLVNLLTASPAGEVWRNLSVLNSTGQDLLLSFSNTDEVNMRVPSAGTQEPIPINNAFTEVFGKIAGAGTGQVILNAT